MFSLKQRVNYDLIADLYDEPGPDYGTDTNLVEFLDKKVGQQPSQCCILDMGCGTGKQLAANHDRFPNLQAVGLDLFHGMLLQGYKQCEGIHWVQGDSANPPIANDSFDYITNQFSYHHVQDKNGMISATFRILKPWGRFVLTNIDPWSMPGWIVYTYFPASRQRDPLPSNFYHVPYVPGLAMAERSDLLIHHGGYGSCQTGLYMGKPAVIIPTFST